MGFDFLFMQKVKNGDSEAGEQFIKKYYSAIYQYCFLHIRNCNDAEDMTQETFVRFFESLKTYKDCGKIKSYLYCIAGNIIKKHKKGEVLLVDTKTLSFTGFFPDIWYNICKGEQPGEGK